MQARSAQEMKPPTTRYNWRVLGVLVLMLAVGYVAVLPAALTTQAAALRNLPGNISLPLLIAVQALSGIAIFSVLAGVGLLIAGRIGLGAPILQKWTEARPVKDEIRRILWPSILLGVVGGSVLLVLERLVFGPLLQADLARQGISLPSAITPPAWQGLLASVYGAFDEEILMRLFVLTALSWIGSRIWKSDSSRPRPGVLWTANILAGVLFGLGHLPATAAAGLPIDALVITRAVVLNGLLGVGFGWLYFTRGLESAMLAHFSADIMLHVIGALLVIV
jgi:membrane protease YdiL (CAAX protease family)